MHLASTRWKAGLAILFTLATIFLIVKADALGTIGQAFSRIGPQELLLLGLLFAALRVMQAVSLVVIIKNIGVKLPFRASLDLAGLKGFYNLGLGGAGLVAQAVHAHSQQLFSVPQLAWTTALQSLLFVSALGALLFFSATSLTGTLSIALVPAAFGLTACLAPFLALSIFERTELAMRLSPSRYHKKLRALKTSFCNTSREQLFIAWLIQVVIVFIRLTRILFIAFFLNPFVPIASLAVTTLAADLVTVVPLTPGGIGMREFFIGIGAQLAGAFELFVAAALIDRGVAIAGNLVHGVFTLSAHMLRH